MASALAQPCARAARAGDARCASGRQAERGLRALGAEPVEVPVLEIRPPQILSRSMGRCANSSHYDWLIFTSANTVRALAERAAALGFRFEMPAMPQGCRNWRSYGDGGAEGGLGGCAGSGNVCGGELWWTALAGQRSGQENSAGAGGGCARRDSRCAARSRR